MAKNKRGVTLVVLIITVVILLILAGVVFSTLVGSDGIITKARTSSNSDTNCKGTRENRIRNSKYTISKIRKCYLTRFDKCRSSRI